MLNSSISSTYPQNVVNVGPLPAEIRSGDCDIPANFNGFRVLAALLHRLRSTAVNQTLSDVWPSPGIVHCIYKFWRRMLLTGFCQVQNSLCVQGLRSPILAVLLHGTRAVDVSQTLRRGTRNGTTKLSQSAPPIWQGGHHVGHRPTFLV